MAELKTWDERYSSSEYVYGKDPNAFLVEKIQFLTPGKILFPAEGEGRNAVYAAQLGWDVEAFDSSIIAKHKAMSLALEKNVKINYSVGSVESVDYPMNTFDAIALIYVHLVPEVREPFFRKIRKWLKPGGILILECFEKSQLPNTSGGPKIEEMLYDIETIRGDLSDMDISILEHTKVTLSEGALHQGLAEVVRVYAKK